MGYGITDRIWFKQETAHDLLHRQMHIHLRSSCSSLRTQTRFMSSTSPTAKGHSKPKKPPRSKAFMFNINPFQNNSKSFDLFSARIDSNAFSKALDAGSTGGWHEGLSRQRMIQRFVMSWQLRVDDTYLFSKELIGPYEILSITLTNTSTVKAKTRALFKEYYETAINKGMFPKDWSTEDVKMLWKVAEKDMHIAITKAVVVDRFGYASLEHMVLRSMANQVLGPIKIV
jgi:hypothetical protein